MNHGPWLALGPRWTHYHGATRASQILGTHPLRGMGGRRDSLVRERERERGGGRQGSHHWRHLAAGLWR
jgi:hypothetical protein